MTASGYAFGAKKWMKAEHKPFLEKYIMNYAIPCMCIDGFIRYLSPETLRGSLSILAVSSIGLLICFVLSALIAYLLRLPRKRAGVFIGMGAFSNALFVGYPMCKELFGEEAIIYVMLFFICASVLIFIGCYLAFAWYSETERKLSKAQIIKIFINPPVLSAVVGVIIVMAGIPIPRPLSGLIGYVSATVSPLALLYCGFVIYEAGIKNIRFDRGMAAMPVMRFVLAPLVGAGLCRLFGLPPLATSVIIVEMAMPVITILVVLAKQWEADVEYAAVGIVLSTLACFVVIPVLMLIM
jgi:predicted permease